MYDENVPRMKYQYTAYHETEEERIVAVANDILIEYPRLGVLAVKAAAMEDPFGASHEDYSQFSDEEHHINRLINIIIITEGKKAFVEEYNKACDDLELYYDLWKHNFTYANPEEQPAYYVMTSFYAHKRNKDIPIMTYKAAKEEIVRRAKERELETLANRLRFEIPNLGPIADQVAFLEQDSGIWLKYDENSLNRLMTIIKLTENVPGYEDVYNYALEKLNADYEQWKEIASRYSDISDNVNAMMDILKRHIDGEDIEIATLTELIAHERADNMSKAGRR